MMYSGVSVVVPVYNSEGSIGELYCRLEKVLSSITGKFEIIMIDDGSSDDSFKEMGKLLSGGKAVSIIRLEENFGQQNATMCGLRHASGDYVITIDDDLQNPPEEIPKLLAGLEKGFDVVYGIPEKRKQSRARTIGTVMTDVFFTIICTKPWNVRVSSFRAMKRQVVMKIIEEKSSFVYITAITLKHTRNMGNAVVSHDSRKYGSSNYSLRKLISLYCRLVVNYSCLSAVFKTGSVAPQYIIKDTGEPI